MQLRNNVNGHKKRKAMVSPETVRDTKAKNPDLDVSFHHVSGRDFEDDLADENESEEDSDVNDVSDSYSIRSQNDQDKDSREKKNDVSKCESMISSDHFSTNRYALLIDESDAKTVTATISDSP